MDEVDDFDPEWEVLANAMRQNAVAQGHNEAVINAYIDALRPRIERAFKTKENVTLAPGDEKFIRTHHRKRLVDSAAGTVAHRVEAST